MKSRRWLRIIPVALIMYTISYVDRTNISIALTPDISSMVKDLGMDKDMMGRAAGIFFFGYVLLQIPGGYLASRWSARKLISLCLMGWGLCAIGCGLAQSFRQFEAARFLLGAAESAVFPAMLVLLANWFPRSERARANAYWNLCQPLAVVIAALSTGALLGHYGWRTVIVLEGMLPFLWLPIWWFLIRDRPRDAKWISAEEREHLETTLLAEAAAVEPPKKLSFMEKFCKPLVLLLIVIDFFHNCLAYGCMTFFTSTLKGRDFSALQHGMLFAFPYTFTAVLMVLVSRHSDKVNERRMHVALTYVVSGIALILSVSLRNHFWWSYAFLCVSIPGPSVALAPFWTIASETLPSNTRGAVMGLVNACGNLGGYYGPAIVGWLYQTSGTLEIPFDDLGFSILIAACLTYWLPKTAPRADK
jgi:sugar phosphate permease